MSINVTFCGAAGTVTGSEQSFRSAHNAGSVAEGVEYLWNDVRSPEETPAFPVNNRSRR